MFAIWKYPLEITDDQFIDMPVGARPLTVQVQKVGRGAAPEQPCLWAMVDPDAPLESHHFRVVGTGHKHDNPVGPYIGTFQTLDGAFVGHVFEGVPVHHLRPGD